MPRGSALPNVLRVPWLAVGAMLLCGAAALNGQDSPPPADPDAVATIDAPAETPKLSIAVLEARQAAVAADPDIEEAAKAALKTKYTEAIGKLKLAEDHTKRSAGYREAIRSAPVESDELAKRFEALPSVEESAQLTSGLTAEALN